MISHGEKLARAALEKWLAIYSKQLKCDQCILPSDARCHRHAPEITKLIRQTRLVLEGGPN